MRLLSTPIDFAALQARVDGMRASVAADPRRATATATFCRLYGIPDTRVMDYFADHGCRLVGADAAIFGLLAWSGGRWHGSAHCDVPATLPRGELLMEWCAITGMTFAFDDQTGYASDFADVRALGWRGVAAMPMLVDGVPVGALLLGRVGGAPWTPADRHALESWVTMNAILNDRRAEVVAEATTAGAAADARFGTIFERAPMGVVLVDQEGRYEAVNPAFAELAGVTRESIVGKRVRDIAVALDNDPSSAYLDEMLAGRRRGYTAERKMVQPNGTVRIVRVTTAPLRDPRADKQSHLAIIEDVSDQRHAENALREREEQLRHAQKMEAIGQLAGGLAHDFSNTLAAIAGFASLLREDTAPDDPRRKDVDGILRVTQRASSITRRLLTVSKKQVQERATLDLREVLEEFGTLVRPVLPASIAYRLELPAPPVYATIDRTQIEQALLNLALNARDAMPNGGTLTIALTVLAREAVNAEGRDIAQIAVTDTGRGITAELMSRLWEPFFTTKSRGSGLGLPMSRAILREHGGDLQVESEVGRWARFTMLVPVADAGARPSRNVAPAGISLAAPPTGQTVLLVDDEEAVRVTSRRLLERAGFTVLVAEDGAAGWRVFLANIDAVDIVVTDLIMPELSGRELVRRIRGNVSEMPVVVTSAYPPDSDPARGTDEQPAVNATLVKPFTGSVLVQTVREVLATHHRRDRSGPALSVAPRALL